MAGVEVEWGGSSQIFRARVLKEEKAFTGKSGGHEWKWLGRGMGRRVGHGLSWKEGWVSRCRDGYDKPF